MRTFGQVTPFSECRCKFINIGLYHHHRVECRLLGSVSLDWFALGFYACTVFARFFALAGLFCISSKCFYIYVLWYTVDLWRQI